jgi:hypothetical protein
MIPLTRKVHVRRALAERSNEVLALDSDESASS